MGTDSRDKEIILIHEEGETKGEIWTISEHDGLLAVESVKPVDVEEEPIDETDSSTFVDEESLKWM